MQAQQVRHIKSGNEFNGHFPIATNKDTVIASSAGLDQTIALMQSMVPETTEDTQKIAALLKKPSLMATCQTIWNFVYQHIQYKRDKTGIEQVRRPSRSWADRHKGVDCDCYSVFISSILMNLGIPHRIRITKYNGRSNFQHVYPVVPTTNGHITLDCVTDRFNHEVPFSDHRDYEMSGTATIKEDLSGVDTIDLESTEGLAAFLQPRLPLRQASNPNCEININIQHQYPQRRASKTGVSKPIRFQKKLPKLTKTRQGTVVSPFRNGTAPRVFMGKQASRMKPKNSNSGPLIKTLLVVGIGYGTYKLFSSSKSKPKPKPKLKKSKTKK